MSHGEPLTVTIRCDVCEKVCAVFELLPPGVARKRGPDDPLRSTNAHRIYVCNFERSGDSEISPRKYERLCRALRDSDFEALYVMDWQNVVFWCRECGRCYCIDHWSIEYPHDDPMCSEFGTCPNGHGKILD